MITDRRFVLYFHFTGFSNFSLGITISVSQPNIEVHIPFGFIRFGWEGIYSYLPSFESKTYGIGKNKINKEKQNVENK